ncbi:MAG: NERD domain-containing protein [Ruminococcaceae bacterium]|nr:NERD domain-containing protein [Oscillospiraceae bacterium]
MEMFNRFKETKNRILMRSKATSVPLEEEIEQFGSNGEDTIYRILLEEFDCVIRNVVIPHKKLYLEKDFLVIHRGVPVVIEVKNWKGTIGINKANGNFYQDKPNGVHKELKSPVATTLQFIQSMKDFYKLERTVVGIVVFAEPDCKTDLPEQLDGIKLVTAPKMVAAVKAAAKNYCKEKDTLSPEHVLRCTRIYSANSRFCKGILANKSIHCFAENGDEVLLHTDYLRYISVKSQPLRLRDKLEVTFTNGAIGTYYNKDTMLSFCCMDGSCCQIALNKVRYILF